MVRLVQLVEHQIVVLVVVGSSPTSHPTAFRAHLSLRLLVGDFFVAHLACALSIMPRSLLTSVPCVSA